MMQRASQKGTTVRQKYFGTLEFPSSTRFLRTKQHGIVVVPAHASGEQFLQILYLTVQVVALLNITIILNLMVHFERAENAIASVNIAH